MSKYETIWNLYVVSVCCCEALSFGSSETEGFEDSYFIVISDKRWHNGCEGWWRVCFFLFCFFWLVMLLGCLIVCFLSERRCFVLRSFTIFTMKHVYIDAKQKTRTDGKKKKTWYNGSVSTAGARSSRRSPNVRYVGLPKYRASWRKLLEKRMTCRIGLVDLFFNVWSQILDTVCPFWYGSIYVLDVTADESCMFMFSLLSRC